MKIKLFIAFLGCAMCGMCSAQQALSNDSIVKMVKSGLSEDVVISMIQSQPGDYAVTPDSLIALKNAGVTDKELAAMAAKGTEIITSRQENANQYQDLDVGVYYKVNGQWTMLSTEQVNWKTGGVLKSIATDGIVKGDINGRLKGATSPTKVTSIDFLIEVPEGNEATDFQLVRLHDKKDAREFRTVTGGVFHASGGSSRDAVQFEQKRIARYTYIVTVTGSLTTGEYAFLAPGLTGSSAGGSLGKAYTFHLIE